MKIVHQTCNKQLKCIKADLERIKINNHITKFLHFSNNSLSINRHCRFSAHSLMNQHIIY